MFLLKMVLCTNALVEFDFACLLVVLDPALSTGL